MGNLLLRKGSMTAASGPFVMHKFKRECGEDVMKLTERQKRFVDFYIETGNASEAARLAGYSKKTAPWIGQENLQKPIIQQAINARMKQIESKRIAKMDEVLQFYTSAMRGELTDDQVVVEGTGGGCSEARTIEVRISSKDRIKAAENLMKRYPMELDTEEQKARIRKLTADVQNALDEHAEDDVRIIDDLRMMTMTTTKLSDVVARQFISVHRDIQEHNHTYYWLKGGRGSTKSSFISIEIPFLMLKNPMCHAVVLRKVGNTVKNSVFPQLQWGIDSLGLSGKFKSKTSPHEIRYKKTGQKILFLGCDDPQKIKSIKLPFGYVGIVWYEELDQFSGMEEIRNLNQSLLRGGSKFWVFGSFNPPKSQNNWVNEEQIVYDPARLVHHSTYLNVPHDWLGPQFFDDAEKLKAKNYMSYDHEYLGKVTGTGGAVFDNVEDMEMSRELVESFDHVYYGLDFGFSIDPLAFVAMHYDATHAVLYLFDDQVVAG